MIREYSDDNFSYNKEHNPYDATEPASFIEVKPSISLESKPEIKIELPINIGLD